MNTYRVKTVTEPVAWNKIEVSPLQECSWSPNAAPRAGMQAVYLPEKGLVFHLKSFSPPARAENWEPDSPVWEDSCLEAFVSFDGEKYINLECNANSALLSAVGSDRENRRFLSACGVEMPQASAVESPDSWEVYLFLPSGTVSSLFDIIPGPGTEFRANFYSCGDAAPSPHYSSWNPIETEIPDFHRPEYFGTLIIE